MVVMFRRDAFCSVLAKTNLPKSTVNLRNLLAEITKPIADVRGPGVEIASLMPGLTSIMRGGSESERKRKKQVGRNNL